MSSVNHCAYRYTPKSTIYHYHSHSFTNVFEDSAGASVHSHGGLKKSLSNLHTRATYRSIRPSSIHPIILGLYVLKIYSYYASHASQGNTNTSNKLKFPYPSIGSEMKYSIITFYKMFVYELYIFIYVIYLPIT